MPINTDSLFSDTLQSNDSLAIADTAFGVGDSVLAITPIDTIIPVSYPCFFSESIHHVHTFQGNAGEMNSKPLLSGNFDWVFVVVISGFVILAHTRWLYGRRLKQVAMAFLGDRYLFQLAREGQLSNERISIGMFVLFVSQVALLLLVFSIEILNIGYFLHYDLNSYLILLGAVVAFWFLRMLINVLISALFGTGKISSLYLMNMLVFNFMTGIILLILSVSMIWTGIEVFSLIYMGSFVLIWIYRIYRGIGIGLMERYYSVFYLMVYVTFIELIFPAIIFKTISLIYLGEF